ncbi:uncharacterized protein BJ212DRAFT_1579186 [Suillus subaureus]|uniref:Uncharacterized protein n=1 Tax=Suillus subaureus TaxID=48587 RepID=A0A9P7E564_9AGAM|nr:uncharacterized protein BJ212DRAFT_1579186 [Suillus subaureus]KAG1811133.1 hypothetical protein BJ212DRAFT_1579186 [Suillus subaureus]
MYSSQAMLEAHEAIKLHPPDPSCKLETVIAAVMLWSDSTHLTSFGSASLWLIYLFLRNQSKYIHGKPSSFAAHHLAYIPKLSNTIQDFYRCVFGKPATAEMLTYCRQELMQAIWLLLMDDDFMHAYEFGVVIKCLDGISRRVFPQFFSYSADYPEKTLLSCIKFLDLLHEFELGVWKAVFTHLLHILYAYGEESIQRLNQRYQQVPTFGQGTIQHFSSNASAMKCLAARDFEDLLQCVMPVFEQLLPSPLNEMLLDLLFELTTWHGLAKLQLHTETTLGFLDTSTTHLGKCLQKFMSKTAKRFVTCDLPSEEAARGHCKARAAAKGGNTSSRANATGPSTGVKAQYFNFMTYKLHTLGDYVSAIRLFSTTDNNSTQLGKLEHRRVKHFYPRVKHKLPSKSKKGKAKVTDKRQCHTANNLSKDLPSIPFEASEPLAYSDPKAHYHIASSTRYFLNVQQWLGRHSEDRALEDFLPQLKDHLLARMLGHRYNGDETEFSAAEQAQIVFVNDCDHAPSFNSPQEMDFLWVRWFGHNPNNYQSGWNAKRLHRLGFIPADEPGTFGFLDPRQIIRGIHLIPAFVYGRTDELLPPSISRPLHENNEDWRFYYVNMFVDRDMFMRFRGGGVGHKSTRSATQIFRNDHDPLDCVAPGDNADSEEDEEASDSEEDEEASEGDEEGAAEGDEEGAAEGAIDEGIIDQDEDEVGESEMEEFGYGGLDQEEDDTDSDEDDSSSDNEDNDSDLDNDLGPEDGEDENEEELEGYGEL